MDLILIIFIVVVIICMGYILSKPFTNQTNSSEEPPVEVDLYEEEYKTLLMEIKDIERDCESGALPEWECAERIEQKKKEAANMLRSMSTQYPPGGENGSSGTTPAETREEPEETISYKAVGVCPQCGGEVAQGDKFCMHCGHPLQP